MNGEPTKVGTPFAFLARGVGLAYPELGHRPPCLGLVWSIKVIAYLLGEEMGFV